MADAEAYGDLRIMVVDDNATMRDVVAVWIDHCQGMHVVATARDGADAVEQARSCTPDVVVMDVEMPRMSGPEATARIMQICPDVRVIAHTGHVDAEPVTRMIVAGAVGYAVKGDDPLRLERTIRAAAGGTVKIDREAMPGLFQGVLTLAREEHARRLDTERLTVQLEESYRETATALAAALDMRDEATQDHVDRVATRAVAVGRRLGLDGQDLVDVEYGAIFHDVGKIGIPDSILKSPRPLTDDEWELIKQHTIFGEQIIRPVRFLRNVARIVRHSHEHWDGSGYPDALHSEQIPLASRIVLACDAFDVMTCGRKYQQAFSQAVAVRRMQQDAGSHFDPRVVDALCAVLHEEDRREHPTLSAGAPGGATGGTTDGWRRDRAAGGHAPGRAL